MFCGLLQRSSQTITRHGITGGAWMRYGRGDPTFCGALGVSYGDNLFDFAFQYTFWLRTIGLSEATSLNFLRAMLLSPTFYFPHSTRRKNSVNRRPKGSVILSSLLRILGNSETLPSVLKKAKELASKDKKTSDELESTGPEAPADRPSIALSQQKRLAFLYHFFKFWVRKAASRLIRM